MNREVKFRAKVLNTNNWIYRQPFHIRGTWYMYSQLWDMVPIEHKTIGQYTGLKDKNGVEIYEGDIVQRIYESGSKFVGEVIFEEATYFLKNSEEYAFLANQYDSETLQILCNIHEHPHLLEVQP